MRPWLAGVLILIALGLGGYGVLRLFSTLSALPETPSAPALPWSGWVGATPAHPPYPEDWALSRALAAGEDWVLPKTPEAFRAFAERCPQVPRADLWRWWREGYQHVLRSTRPHRTAQTRWSVTPLPHRARVAASPSVRYETPFADMFRDTAATPPLSDADADALWEAWFGFVRERDPDNGWPFVLMAAYEASRGMETHFVQLSLEPFATNTNPKFIGPGLPWGRNPLVTRGFDSYRVTVPARAARAARLLHEGVRQPRFDDALREATLTDFARFGGKPATYAAMLRLITDLSSYNLPDLSHLRGLTRLATGLAAWGANPDAVDAEDGTIPPFDAATVLHDMQTMAVRLTGEESTNLVPVLVSSAMLWIASGEGDRILRGASRDADAEALHARARRLFHPVLVGQTAYAIRENRPTADRPPARDPAFRAEAEAIVREWEHGDDAFKTALERGEGGMLSRMLLPALRRAAYAPTVTPTVDDLRVAGRFEFYAFFAMLAPAGLVLFATLLFAFLIAYGLARWRFRQEPATAPGWPGVGWALGAGVGFALIWTGATYLFSAMPGVSFQFYLYGHPFKKFAEWSLLCHLWGLLLAWQVLAFLAESRACARLAPEEREAARPRYWVRVGRWLCWLGLYVAQLGMLAMMPVPLVAPEWADVWEKLETLRKVAPFFLLPAGVAVVFQWGWIWLGCRNAAFSLGWTRHLLAGLAGAALAWGCLGFGADALARRYARLDRVLLPDVTDGFVASTRLEGELTAFCARHARAEWAREQAPE